jgi:hypothetical protein
MTTDPTEILKPPLKCRDTGPCIVVMLCHSHQNADLAHVVGLLGVRGERPSGSSAAQKRDEPAPP